jgi:acyl-CoA synthetase (AMP-forming)/AMP-acid ligase II
MIWRSDSDPVPVGGTTLDAMVREAAARFPHRPALVDGASGGGLSYAELADRADRVAALLAERGLGPGDVLALWAPNLPPWAGVTLGAMRAGMAVTGVSPAASEPELAAQLADSGAGIVVTLPAMAAAAERAGARAVIPIGADLLAARGPVPTPELDPATATALLPYSSGTTGPPKGVVLTHANLTTAVRQVLAGLRLSERDTLIAVAPFCHIMGFVVNLAAGLAAGATIVTMPRFDLERYLELAERHRATVLVGAPPLIAALAGHPDVARHDLSAVELIVSGGAPLSAGVQRAVVARFPRAAVGQGWGLTESSVGATMPDRERGTVPGSVGRLMPNTELRVVEGELWVRGPQVMRGYLNRPAETAEILDRDGWLHTGDLGHVDADGNVFVVGRIKELIKVSGYQVPPAELEAVLAGHPAVADAAVIGWPDERRGEVPVAVVVRAGPLAEDELIAWAAERSAPYKRLQAVRFADAIPRTPSGKVLRRVIVA